MLCLSNQVSITTTLGAETFAGRNFREAKHLRIGLFEIFRGINFLENAENL